MSPSTVTALKVSTTASLSIACKAGAAISASVNRKESMVAMSGAIMPAPLAMPLTVTVALPMRAAAVATLGKVSVVMIALAAARKSPGLARGHEAVHHRAEFFGVERLADHAGGGKENLCRFAARGLGGERGGELGRGAAVFAGEGVGVAGIDHQRPRCFRALELRPAPFDRRRGAFRAREHAGGRRAGIEQRQQHVGAVGIADAGLGRCQPHAGDRRHVRHVLRREGGDGGRHDLSVRDLSSPGLSGDLDCRGTKVPTQAEWPAQGRP